MKKRDMTAFLKQMKKDFKLDFVRSDYGHCCRSCADFDNDDIQEEFYSANSYIICNHFLSGMNYQGPFNKQESFYLCWLGLTEDDLKTFKIKFDKSFPDWECILPENPSISIQVKKKENLK